ncbi:MAG: beta-lactamase family protein [Myxococcales bacterium]|nr:beta-lactamase family protein [Myxococcales bacterium]
MRALDLGSIPLLVCLAACQPAPITQSPPAAPATTSKPAPKSAPTLGSPVGQPRTLEAETPVSLPNGGKTTAPAGWKMTELAGGFEAIDPEGDMRIVVLVVPASDAKAAKTKLLEAVGAKEPTSFADEMTTTDEGGWDEIYEVVHRPEKPEDKVFIVNTRRKGDKTVSTVIEGKPGAFSRRGAHMRQIVFGLTMPGVEEEDLSKATPVALDGDAKATFEQAIDEMKELTGAPAVAVAVVRDGQVVFTRAVGTRRAGRDEPVDVHTPFLIGSVTKSLSTLLVARLVDQNKLSWDTKVKELLPTFRTGDPAITDRLTIADTFCACTGMPRQDMELVFEYAKKPPSSIFQAFEQQKPTTAFGETFQYNNQLTTLGGFLAARVVAKGEVGKAFSAAMKKEVFDPMGLKDTTLDFAAARKTAAYPHAQSLLVEGRKPSTLPFDIESFVLPYAPAGGVFSSAADMARYALVELAGGVTPEGNRVVSEANLYERRKPRTKASAKGYYGLGLGSGVRKGLAVVSHDGGTFGSSSRLFLIPERNIGLVVLTNGGGTKLLDGVTSRFLEIVFGEKPRAKKVLERELAEEQRMLEKIRKTDLGAVPEEVGDRLVGKYENGQLGALTVSRAKDKSLVLDAGEWKSRLGYKKDGAVETLTFIDPPVGGLPFRLEGGDLVVEHDQHAYRFVKKR